MTDRTWTVFQEQVTRLEAENRHLRRVLADLDPLGNGGGDQGAEPAPESFTG